MRTFPILLLLAVFAPATWLQGQAVLEPSLGVAFPVKENEGKLLVNSPVLINMNDILLPRTVLHKLFPKPKKEDKDVKTRKIKEYDTGKYAVTQRLAIENREEDPDKSAMMRAAEARAGGESMTSELKFRAALHRMNVEEYYLAYDVAGSSERHISQFDYPEGLLLTEQKSKIVVLAVVVGSVAERVGVVPGSFITELNGKPLGALTDFRDRYFKEKELKKAEGAAVSMAVILPGEKTAKTLEFDIKRSLGTSKDLMSDLDANMDKKKEEKPAESTAPKKAAAKEKTDDDSMSIPLIP